MSAARRRILIAGAPRSGTTWVVNVLANAPGASLAIEPDNEKTSLLASRYKKGLPRFPVFDAGATDAGFERLWHLAFEAPLGPLLSRSWLTRVSLPRGQRAESRIAAKPIAAPRTTTVPAAAALVAEDPANDSVRLVKTVHAVLCLDWVCAVARPHRVVVVERHPLAVIDSWRRLQMPDALRLWQAGSRWLERDGAAPVDLDPDDPLVRMALQAGLMYRCLEDFCAARPDVIRVEHERLCSDPTAAFAALFEQLGLTWSRTVEEALAASNREGRGYRPVRVAQREVGKWQGRFSEPELERIGSVLGAFRLPASQLG